MPKPGQGVGYELHRVGRLVRFFMMGFELVVEQRFEFVRIEVATDHQAHAVGDELDHVVVFEDLRVLGEHGALGRVGNVVFDREQTFLARLDQQVEDKFE